MKAYALPFAALPLLSFAACGTTVAGGGLGSCMQDADCPSGWLCGFQEKEGCNAAGACFLPPQMRCQAHVAGCACDGTAINLACNGLPTGYAPRPFAHTGACAVTASADTASTACSTDADCAAGWICGFPESDGCSAQGSCFPKPEVTCMAYMAGCACDGTEVNIACNGLPSGYAPKPLAHRRACINAGTDCCPADWSMYTCSWPDGGTGLACHDPAMGCASSATCGQGCDKVVSGVCTSG